MKKLYLVVIMCCALLPLLSAQEQYLDQLSQAKRWYEDGQLENIVPLLTPCVENENIPRPVRREMLSLLQTVHLFLDQPERADSVHLKLLRLDPFYRQQMDIPEVRYLFDNFETYPIATYGVRIGIYGFSRPLIAETYLAFPDLDITTSSYKRRKDDLYGWTVNADLSFNLFKSSVELATGIGISNIYLRRNFELSNAHLSSGAQAPAAVSFLERQRWTQIPFLLQINGIPRRKIIESRFVPYFCAGVASEFLIKRAAQAIGPEIDFPARENDRSASIVGLGDQRKRFNVALLAGLGGKIHIKRAYFVLDLRYHRLLRNIASDSNRYTNEELLNTFNYVDDDFRLHNLNVSLGAGIFLFRSKKR